MPSTKSNFQLKLDIVHIGLTYIYITFSEVSQYEDLSFVDNFIETEQKIPAK